MKRHNRDGTALFFGVLFAGVGLTVLVREIFGVSIELASALALTVTVAGLTGLVSTLLSVVRKDDDP